jgi:hypothetical protein
MWKILIHAASHIRVSGGLTRPELLDQNFFAVEVDQVFFFQLIEDSGNSLPASSC